MKRTLAALAVMSACCGMSAAQPPSMTARSIAYVDLERTTGAEADEKVRYSVSVRIVL